MDATRAHLDAWARRLGEVRGNPPGNNGLEAQLNLVGPTRRECGEICSQPDLIGDESQGFEPRCPEFLILAVQWAGVYHVVPH